MLAPYVVVIEIEHAHDRPLFSGDRRTYETASVMNAHGPSQAAKEAIGNLSVEVATRVVRVRSCLVEDVVEVTYPSVTWGWSR